MDRAGEPRQGCMSPAHEAGRLMRASYLASANHDPDGDSDGTTIVVTKQ
jgi:hypothetical protein